MREPCAEPLSHRNDLTLTPSDNPDDIVRYVLAHKHKKQYTVSAIQRKQMQASRPDFLPIHVNHTCHNSSFFLAYYFEILSAVQNKERVLLLLLLKCTKVITCLQASHNTAISQKLFQILAHIF